MPYICTMVYTATCSHYWRCGRSIVLPISTVLLLVGFVSSQERGSWRCLVAYFLGGLFSSLLVQAFFHLDLSHMFSSS